MNLIRRFIGLLLCEALLTLTAHGAVRSSSDYSLRAETVDAGGGRASTANYTARGSVGGIGGLSTAGGVTVKHGFIGQIEGFTPLSDLKVTMADSPDPVLVGSNLTYTITVTNQGAAVATSAKVVAQLPANATFISANSTQGACSQTGNTVSCDLGSITNATAATITIVVTPLATGSITNLATASSVDLDANLADNTAAEVTLVVTSTYVWIGSVSSDWFNPGNWSPAGIPGTNDAASIGSGTVNFNQNATVATLDLAGTLRGTGTLTVTRRLNWTAGIMGDGGSTTIASGGLLNITGSSGKTLLARTLNNAGTVIWNGGDLTGHTGPVINNLAGAVFEMQSDNALNRFNNALVFNNAGTLRKSGGTGTKSMDMVFNNSGTVELQSGIISLSGDYTSGMDSSLRMIIGGTEAGSQFSQLQITGVASLTGGLVLSLTNQFLPGISNRFPIITWGSRTGVFAIVAGRALGAGLSFQTNYQATALVLTVTNAPLGVESQLLRLEPLRSGGRIDKIQIRLPADAPGTYRIERSTNLQTWEPALELTPASGETVLEDNEVANLQRRFYRPIRIR